MASLQQIAFSACLKNQLALPNLLIPYKEEYEKWLNGEYVEYPYEAEKTPERVYNENGRLIDIVYKLY